MSLVQIIFGFLFLSLNLVETFASTRPLAWLSFCLKSDNVTFVPRSSDSKLYKKLNYQWNTINYIEPWAYIVPKNTVEVQIAIRCTRSLDIPITIKSGGHSYAKYSFGDNSSMVIDLHKLNNIKIDKVSSTADVGPGAVAGQLHYHTWKNGFVTPAGMCVSIGIGGATLGGGYGWLSKKFGLMADNVLEMEMVTAEGDILKINSRRNEDLFWALRGGGGGNFGIVTKFKFRLFEAKNLRYQIIDLQYSLNASSAVLDAVQKSCLKLVDESIFLIAGFTETGIFVYILGFNLSEDEIQKLVDEFPKNGSKSINSFSSFPEVAKFFPVSVNISKVSMLKKSSALRTDPDFVKVKSYFTRKIVGTDAIQNLSQVLHHIPSKFGFYIISFGGEINKVPQNETGFVHRSAIYNIELKIGSDDAEGALWLKDFKAAISNFDDGESYQNIVDATLPDYLQRYYGTNLQRLRHIKTKYDPSNYFNFPQSIPRIQF